MKKLVIIFLLCSVTQLVWAGKRVALVIGNADYSIANGRLNNPVNDATSVAAELTRLGYQVALKTDLNNREMMETAVEAFARNSVDAEIALFYYSGHGVQYNGENYLMPTQAQINNASQIRHRAMNVNFLLDEISAGGGLHLVILDSCRDNPYPRDSKSSAAKGMARMDAPSSTIIAYATQPGATADDGNGKHSPYTQQLLYRLKTEPNKPINDVLNRVNVAVEDMTQQRQSPRLDISPLRNQYCFGLCDAIVRPPAQVKSALTIKTSPADARVRILNIIPSYHDGIELAPGRYQIEVTTEGYQRHIEWIELSEQNQIHSVVLNKTEAPLSVVSVSSTSPSQPVTPSDPYGIPMVNVPAGCFQMGSNNGDSDEKPVHRVCLSAFQIGQTEVTQGQWRAVMGNNPSHFSNCGNDCPVEEVSWDDAQDFIRTLNRQTGQNYRLPTEAEWEYVCRSGGRDETYCGGDNVDAVAWYDSNSGVKTHRVAQKTANGLGLYDMSGNVWEWVQDWYGVYPSGSVTDPQGPSGGSGRVFRGGSWHDDAGRVRSALRYFYVPGLRRRYLGFRLARSR
jgi:formylglycine-generating enzyme required for sulfatase activity